MTYPGGSTYPITEWLVDGTWTDLSARIRGEVNVTSRGRQSEQGSSSPMQVSCTMDDTDNELSNRNPNSAWYRKIPAGTQIRHRAGDGDNHMYMPFGDVDVAEDLSSDFTSVRTADKAALDIVGDFEVRVDVRPHTWRPAARVMVFASKYRQAGDQRSWALYLDWEGQIRLTWSTSGAAAGRVFVTSTAAIPATSGRLSIKATLDVNNGAGGSTVAFYTATSISGTYTQLGASVVTAGVTSVFSSTAPLICGGGDDVGQIFTDGIAFGGRFYGLHLYNSAGTRVANPDFTGWSLDDTSKADSHSNTWAVSGQARPSSPRVRFWGELVSAGHATDRTTTDNTVAVQEADLTQRLGNAKKSVEAPLSLNIRGRSGLLGWWPCDDGESATTAASGLSGGAAASAPDVTFGQSSDLAGASQVVALPNSTSKLRFKMARGTNTGFWQSIFMFKVPSLPAAESSILSLTTTGTARSVVLSIGTSTFRINMYAADGTSLLSTNVNFGTGVVVADEWIAFRIQLDQNGANIDWALAWYQQGSSTFWGTSGSFAATAVGYPTTGLIQTSMASEFNGVEIAHVVVAQEDMGFASNDLTWSSAIDAYAGERTAARIRRMCVAAGLHCEVIGLADSSARLGPQPIDTPMNVLENAAESDGGLLYGLRDYYGIGYRTRQDLERHRDISLSYGELAEVPQVFEDGQTVVNDVTVRRDGGSSARVEITDGPNSVSDPPNGVSPREGGGTLNLYTDAVLPDVANLRARYGSFDQARIPNLAVAYHRTATAPTTTVGAELMHADLGCTAAVDGWPGYLPPDEALFLLQGYTETLGTFLWSQTWNVTPAGPYQTGVYDCPDQTGGKTRWGAGTSTLNAGVTTSATTIVVAGTARVKTVEVWTTDTNMYPQDVVIDGEQITLTQAPSGSTSPQTFANVTRSVNGIVATHDAGAAVRRYTPVYWGLRD